MNKNTEIEIIKGELHFNQKENGFVCRELVEIPKRFETVFNTATVDVAIQTHLNHLREMFELSFATKEERDAVPENQRKEGGGLVFDELVKTISTSGLSLFQQLMFWMSDWWYYNQTLRTKCSFNWSTEYKNSIDVLIREFVLALLPKQVQSAVEGMTASTTAVGFGHFAILFVDNDSSVRRIITDTQLFEMHDVSGYTYLDITAEGKPVARSVTSRNGGRAFFDGTYLMSHDMFCTCAPKTVVINSGYKVNSTQCTVVNGILFPLIESNDAVARTTGAFMGMSEFSNVQALESYALSEATGTRLKIDGSRVSLDNKELKPIGVFQPSSVHLLESGFALYDWSDFHEVMNCRFNSVLVIDDKKDWINRFQQAFGTEIQNLKDILTNDREKALRSIIEEKPEVVILDMHLTESEGFEGLWIANQLFINGFEGKIVIASSYPDKQLEAMTALIKGKVWAPGKNIDRIRKLLCNTDWR
jgi:CheY-like chemotaxis protein